MLSSRWTKRGFRGLWRFDRLARPLVPPSVAKLSLEAVTTVTVGTGNVFRTCFLQAPLTNAFDDGSRLNIVCVVALAASPVDGFAREHDSRRCAWSPGSPGFIIDVLVAIAVASSTPDAHSGVRHRNFFLSEVQMTDVASAIVRAFHLTRRFSVVLQEQQRFLLLSRTALSKQVCYEDTAQSQYQAGASHARRV